MGTTYLLDSNIAIYILNNTLKPSDSSDLNKASVSPFNLSVISKMELLGWDPPDNMEAIKLTDFVSNAIILHLSNKVVDKTIEIRRATRIKLPDAIIAATALVNNFTLLTRNIPDFSNIPGMKVINPFK